MHKSWANSNPCMVEGFILHLFLLVSVFQVHSNNRHTQGVRVFNKVECLFKPGILQPWSSPLTLPVPLEDLKDPSSRPISLPLGGRPAQILRCKFYFADRWLLISEISFLSGRKELQSSIFFLSPMRVTVCLSDRQYFFHRGFALTSHRSWQLCLAPCWRYSGDLALPKQ